MGLKAAAEDGETSTRTPAAGQGCELRPAGQVAGLEAPAKPDIGPTARASPVHSLARLCRDAKSAPSSDAAPRGHHQPGKHPLPCGKAR